jgi:hypothetical protein
MAVTVVAKRIDELSNPSDGGEEAILSAIPIRYEITIEGHADYLCHAWNDDAVEAKSKAAKGSRAKKEDDIESYVYRNDKGELCIPGSQFRASLFNAARFIQDPRSPRKSAMDLFKAGIVSLTPLASTGLKTWDYIDRQRVVVQRNAISRHRPALRAPWRATFVTMVTVPEYISRSMLQQVATRAGQLCGVGNYRPTYGRYGIVSFNELPD